MKNPGNPENIINVMRRAGAGEPVTIGFIGGSITQGAAASDESLCYAARVFKWWKDSFPKAKVRYINAGIGATTSQFGAARVYDDLLKYTPDLVIVEYSVNDNDETLDGAPADETGFDRSALFKETYEGLIRKLLAFKSPSGHTPAVLIVHSVKYDNGRNAEDIHAEIGRHYMIPCLSMKELIYDRIKDGSAGFSTKDITTDMLHPNDHGHGIVAGCITDYLNSLKKCSEREGPEKSGAADVYKDIPSALTADKYEHVNRYNRLNSKPELNGFLEDDAPVMQPFFINTASVKEEHAPGRNGQTERTPGRNGQTERTPAQNGQTESTAEDDRVLSSEVRDVFKNGWTASKKGDSITFGFKGSELAVMYRKS
ncbi:MAG: SGNH/GDSL hydrolase family protein, partial [Lachnospiraceae bacterium]|nr:SGNH/GDSL hydrolase family protein [Lachnospiraceae bacterium]